MDALDQLRQHTAKEREAKALRDRLLAQKQLLVKAAFDQGHTGAAVAAAAGCSKERAYQLRDGGRRRRPVQAVAALDDQDTDDAAATPVATVNRMKLTGHPLAAHVG